MTKRERILAAIKREPTDRPPYAFWRHFPNGDRSPAALAQTTLRFHERYGSDFLKVTPAGGYAVQDWGCVESEDLAPDGHRPWLRPAAPLARCSPGCSARCRWRESPPVPGSLTTSRRTRASSRTRSSPSPRRS